jgi:hypothetical protein
MIEDLRVGASMEKRRTHVVAPRGVSSLETQETRKICNDRFTQERESILVQHYSLLLASEMGGACECSI